MEIVWEEAFSADEIIPDAGGSDKGHVPYEKRQTHTGKRQVMPEAETDQIPALQARHCPQAWNLQVKGFPSGPGHDWEGPFCRLNYKLSASRL